MNTPTEIHATHHPRVGTRTGLGHVGQLAGLAGLGWLGVGVLGVWDVARDENGEGPPYVLFSITLLLAAAFTLAAAESCTRATDRAASRWCGLGVGVIAVASTLVAWASPLWMTLLATSLAMLAVAAPPDMRRGLATVVAGHVAGIVVTVVAVHAEVGRQDSYGAVTDPVTLPLSGAGPRNESRGDPRSQPAGMVVNRPVGGAPFTIRRRSSSFSKSF